MKKGILAVSFGTSHIDTMEKTIDVLEKEFAKTFEEAAVYRAFTSNMIIKKLKRTANIKVQTVGEALEKMAADGIEEVIVQPTHVINGIENDRMLQEVMEHMHLFRKVYVGKPLLSSVEDYKKAIHAVMEKTVIGEDESELEEKGYEVRVILKGLGEFEGIRKIFAEHIEEAEM